MNNTPDNCIIVNGRTIKMTPEIVEKLKQEGIIPKYTSPFERVPEDESYWGFCGNIDVPVECVENRDIFDDHKYTTLNYFNDKDFAVMIGLRFRLWRELLKFSYDTNTHMSLKDMEPKYQGDWIGMAYVVKYIPDEKDFIVSGLARPGICDVTFTTREAAKEAIEKVVKPFVEKHPEMMKDLI